MKAINGIIVKKEYAVESLKIAFPEIKIYEDIHDGEVLITEPSLCKKEILSKMPSLKWIQLARAGYDEVDMTYIKEHNICLSNARGLYSIPIAEDIICKILIYANKSLAALKNQKDKVYERVLQRRCLASMTIGFYGTGSIASETVLRLKPFGCRIVGFKRNFCEGIPGYDKLYYSNQLSDFLNECDVVVLCASANEQNYHCINKETLQYIKKGSAIINIARGSLIDEIALLDALQKKAIDFAGLDVFENEPLVETHPLWDEKNVIITAHGAGTCVENHDTFRSFLIENIQNYIEEKQLHNVIIGENYENYKSK